MITKTNTNRSIGRPKASPLTKAKNNAIYSLKKLDELTQKKDELIMYNEEKDIPEVKNIFEQRIGIAKKIEEILVEKKSLNKSSMPKQAIAKRKKELKENESQLLKQIYELPDIGVTYAAWEQFDDSVKGMPLGRPPLLEEVKLIRASKEFKENYKIYQNLTEKYHVDLESVEDLRDEYSLIQNEKSMGRPKRSKINVLDNKLKKIDKKISKIQENIKNDQKNPQTNGRKRHGKEELEKQIKLRNEILDSIKEIENNMSESERFNRESGKLKYTLSRIRYALTSKDYETDKERLALENERDKLIKIIDDRNNTYKSLKENENLKASNDREFANSSKKDKHLSSTTNPNIEQIENIHIKPVEGQTIEIPDIPEETQNLIDAIKQNQDSVLKDLNNNLLDDEVISEIKVLTEKLKYQIGVINEYLAAKKAKDALRKEIS